jgi:hypothetical protein
VLLKREGEHTIEIHLLETHRRDMTQDGWVDVAPAARSPAIERGLHLMGVPGHNKVRHERERERAGLGAQLFRTASATGPTSRPSDLVLQGMCPFIVVEKP